jgi:hypothetical protein
MIFGLLGDRQLRPFSCHEWHYLRAQLAIFAEGCGYFE